MRPVGRLTSFRGMSRLFAPGRYANVTATLALVVALSGTAYAATKIRSKDIANGQVKRADLGKGAVTSSKVKDRSLTRKDLKKGALRAGATGATGATGQTGPKGDKGDKGDTGPIGATTPVAVVNVNSNGTVRSQVSRSPVTGPVTVAHTAGTGTYVVDLPGVDYTAGSDAVACTSLTNLVDEHRIATNSGSGDLYVLARKGASTGVDLDFSCAIYDLN